MSSYDANQDEMAKAASLMHLTRAGWPESNLAEWLIVCTEQERYAYAGMRTVGEGQQQVTDIINKIKDWKKGDPLIYGPNELLKYLGKTYPKHLGNYSPSLHGGLGRKQLVYVAGAQKSGAAPDIKPRSKIDKFLGRNKDREMIASQE